MSEKEERASKARCEIHRLLKRLSSLGEAMVEKRALIKGTIYENKRKCGYPHCRCAKGELHQTTVLSFSHHGKAKTIALTKQSASVLKKIQDKVRHYQEFRQSRAAMVQVFSELLERVNQLEQSLLNEVPPVGRQSRKEENTHDKKPAVRRNN